MDKGDKFDIISVACRSRLIFRTEAEYRDALGVSFETVVNNRSSERDMDIYFGVLDNKTHEVGDEGLDDIINAYTEASEIYTTLDWGDRSQKASLRKFCRRLFRLYATGGKKLSSEEICKFNIKNDDDRLLKVFFPDGTDELPSVDVRLIVLFAFGVLRPFTGTSRGRDIGDKETVASLERLRDLIGVLREDMPRLGSTEKPLIFDEQTDTIGSYLGDRDARTDCTPLWMWSLLMDITQRCRSLVNPEQLRTENERFSTPHMYGIWVDDADGGTDRFWIFPDNIIMAYCYEHDGMMWRLIPYEFRVISANNPDYYDQFILTAPDGNLDFILSPDKVINPDHISHGLIEGEWDEEGEICRVEFSEAGKQLPDWFKWRSWERLSRDDWRYARFHTLLEELYDPDSPRSMFLDNTAPELTNRYNNLVGRDKKYLYVYDWTPGRFVIRERGTDTFLHEVAPGEELPADTLFGLEVSEQHPLYAIPLDIQRKGHGSLEMDRFVKALSDADNIHEVYIVHSDRTPHPRMVFAEHASPVDLNMEILGPMGAVKFTRSPAGGGH